MVVGVFRGSPAEKGGLHAGDIMLTVDGKPPRARRSSRRSAGSAARPGTTVELTVRNGADGPVRTVDTVRDDVHIEPVSWTMGAGTKTAILRLEQFSTGAADEAPQGAPGDHKAGAERLVFDLRGNPGGFVNEAVARRERVPAGSGNVYIERNAKGEEKAIAGRPGGLATTIPLVVLIDEGTASAAEIVSGAIQDAGRAQLVGTKTFGTGTVLGEFAARRRVGAADRDSRVADAEGRVIWHAGINPDVTVARPAETSPILPDDVKRDDRRPGAKLADPQLAKALSLVAAAS